MTTPALVFSAARRPRTPLRVDVDAGRIEAGTHAASYDPAVEDGPYLAYLRLVRRMRDLHREPSFVLRSDDVEALARALRQDAVVVLERLGELMGATVTQRRSMVTSFLAGAVLIAVATGAAALVPGDDGHVVRGSGSTSTPAVEDVDEAATVLRRGAPRTSGSSSAPSAEVTGPSASTAPVTRDAAPSAPVTATAPAPSAPRDAVARDDAPLDRPRVVQPGPSVDLPSEDEVGIPEVAQPGATIDLPADDGQIPEVNQPGATIDVPADDDGGIPEVIQPGATIDIPTGDEAGPDDVTDELADEELAS